MFAPQPNAARAEAHRTARSKPPIAARLEASGRAKATSTDSMTPERERELLQRLRRGERAAAEELARLTYRQTFASLMQLCAGRRDLAADLTQETYRRAWVALESFDGRARFSSWLYRIAYNTFLNHRRATDRLQQLPEDAAERWPDEQSPPDRYAEGEQQRHRLRRALFALPEPQRDLLAAVYWGEISIRELAEEAGVTTVAIRKRLAKAQKALRRKLGPRSQPPAARLRGEARQ